MSELSQLRAKLSTLGLDAFIVLSGDAHNSEYVSESDLRRAFITKFTGSAGTALILHDQAFLWTDGRYFLQAELQLSSDWTLMKVGQPGVPDLSDWLVKNMKSGQKVGVDAALIPASVAKTFESKLGSKGIELVGIGTNPLDEVWDAIGRPSAPKNPLMVMGIEKTGLSHNEKIKMVQEFVRDEENNAIGFVVSMLDEVAWMLNFRGNDVQYNPVALSFAVVTLDKTHLFVDEEKVTPTVRAHFGENVVISAYSDISDFLKSLAATAAGKKIIVDGTQVNWSIYKSLGEVVLEKTSPITLAKSKKNSAELDGFRQAHIRDGAALTAFFHWLETSIKTNKANTITEYDVTVKVEEFRARMDMHMGPSFDTIASYGSNCAMMHYKPSIEKSATIGTESTYLQDSGAQYVDGTTDVTRTHHFGTPSQKIKEAYTAVLKGHIALAALVFPESTLGSRMDTLARMALWEQGLDYNHGTGHGVGSFLNVHEGPQSISFRQRPTEVGFYEGMTTSNEPGYYEDGHFGIRIENLCITVPKETPYNFANKKYLGFDTVTMCPIATNMIILERMTAQEISWLNEYHHRVFTTLSPLIQQHFPDAWEYLVDKTKPIAF